MNDDEFGNCLCGLRCRAGLTQQMLTAMLYPLLAVSGTSINVTAGKYCKLCADPLRRRRQCDLRGCVELRGLRGSAGVNLPPAQGRPLERRLFRCGR